MLKGILCMKLNGKDVLSNGLYLRLQRWQGEKDIRWRCRVSSFAGVVRIIVRKHLENSKYCPQNIEFQMFNPLQTF